MITKPFQPIGWLAILLALPMMMAEARPLINEVHVNPPGGADEGFQYIEILTVDDAGNPAQETFGEIHLLVVDSSGGRVGAVEEVFQLQGLSTGANGLLLIGRDFVASNPYADFVAAETTVVDYASIARNGGRGDIGPKGGVSFLLVSNFPASPGADLDDGDSGTLDRPTSNQIIDAVAYGDSPYVTAINAGFSPDNMSRIAGNTTGKTTVAWYGGDIFSPNGAQDSLIFDDNVFGAFVGQATPGQPNVGTDEDLVILINEVLVNPVGDDSNVEFIELINPEGRVAKLDGWHLLVVATSDQVDSYNPGEVIEDWNLQGAQTGENGLILIGNDYGDEVPDPWDEITPGRTAKFSPPRMGNGDIGENQGFSLLLVKGFTGTARTVAQAVITPGTDLDQNDDGILDVTPWANADGDQLGIRDSVGFRQLADNGDPASAVSTYGLADLSQSGASGFHPDGFARVLGNVEANNAGAWYGGEIGGTNSQIGVAFKVNETTKELAAFGPFVGQLTPGLPNLTEARMESDLLINEVHIDPTRGKQGDEFVELLSPDYSIVGLSNHHLLVVPTGGNNVNTISEVFELRGLSTGPNGLLVIRDDSAGASVFSYRGETNVEDPDGLDAGDLGPDGNFSLLLVEGFSGTEGQNLDPAGADQPWTRLVDSVAFSASTNSALGKLPTLDFNPDTLTRIPGNHRRNEGEAWVGAVLSVPSDDTDPGLVYSPNEYFGSYRGEASPGAYNVAGNRDGGRILLNEVHFNPPSDDSNFEFIEIISQDPVQSTNDLTLLLLDVTGTGVGSVIEAWSLDGMATGSNGLLVLGNNYPPLDEEGRQLISWRSEVSDAQSTSPWANLELPIDFGSALGDPDGFGAGDIGDNDCFSLLLVRNFRGAVQDDLDGGEDDDASTRNDGILDVFPWAEIVDSVGFRQFSAADGGFVCVNYAQMDLSREVSFDTVSRVRFNFSPNSAAAWYGGQLSGLQTATSYGATGSFNLPEGASATPGRVNFGFGNPDQDTDGDGVTNGDEEIAGTDPQDSTDFLRVESVQRLSVAGGLRLNLVQWPTVTGRQYVVEFSTDLENWTAIPGSGTTGGEAASANYSDSDSSRTSSPVGYYRINVSAP